jgi:hypothetical protein
MINLKQFLDHLVKEMLNDPLKCIPYTEEMSERARDLISEVEDYELSD